MTGKRIVYYILATFVAGCLLLIYIQYNSAKSIDALVTGNEKLVDEFKVSSELRELEKDVISIESRIRGAVSTKDSSYIQGLQIEINEVEMNLGKLQKITDNDSSVKYINTLEKLVHEKIRLSRDVIDSFHTGYKNSAKNLVVTKKSKKLIDSIRVATRTINRTRNKLLSDVTISIDKSGKKAQRFGTILIVMVLISGAILFWYIINIIRNQQLLIEQLDVSEKKEREAALVKEKFMTNMSHEIRTPLNSMLGFTRLLQRKDLDDDSKEYVQTILKSGENLLAIINDILDLSKIESGMMRIETAPFSIRDLVYSIETMLKVKADEKHLLFIVNVQNSVPGIIEGDATRLTQILINLIGNALKFTNKGSITVTIASDEILNGMVKVNITVADTGIGIENEKLQAIFERFRQAEDSVTRKYGGTGLGLSIVKDLVILQNGSIDITSEPGAGTSFYLAIPYKIPEKNIPIYPLPKIVENPLPDVTGISVLAAEDNQVNQSLLKHLFKSWGLNFDIVSSGKEAVERLLTTQYEVILMDIQMPEMDGYTAASTIRNSLKLDTPIIAMTAHALAGEREKCISYGMNDYISKPIHERQLHQLIEHYARKMPQVPSTITSTPVAFGNVYKTINLQYMQEVSMGNTDYEKTVTEQFIEAIPDELLAMEKALERIDTDELRQLAHNMKTTISVMGLNELLEPYLDIIEFNAPGIENFSMRR
jgi:signal transduction histidine kinase/CheY-like chemotaxis protein